MNYIYLIIAIFFLLFGNIFRVYRWEMLINIYEKPNKRNLLKAMSISALLNFFIPFKLGDIFRGLYSGKNMKNGISCSFATIVLERYFDVLCVGVIYILLYIFSVKPYSNITSILFYIILSFALFILAMLCIKFSKVPKKVIQKFSSVFNNRIELNMLTFTYFFISTFKEVYKKMSKIKLTLMTTIMWIFYLCSYYTFGLFIKFKSASVSALSIFDLLFSKNNLYSSTISLKNEIIINSFGIYLAIFIILPLIIMFIISLAYKKEPSKRSIYKNILPHQNENDRLNFLELYFSGLNTNYFVNYSKISSNITILQDLSAGSNATTMLCKNEKSTFYRKYVFGDSSSKLYDQVEWINKHKKTLPLPKIVYSKYEKDNYCFYDMEYIPDAVGFFNFIHSVSLNRSYDLLEKALISLKKKLYTCNTRKSDIDSIKNYIKTKVSKNLNKIYEAPVFKNIISYDKIVINGKTYNNLKQYSKYFIEENLINVFSNDNYCDIHGDLTVENIVKCSFSKNDDDFYFIDPNSGNVHDSDSLDYAKLLQSLHGNYEFLMHTNDVNVTSNKIDYFESTSFQYRQLYNLYDKYLVDTFSKEKVKSIYYHEIIHWLRLMPYKIEKNGKRALLFYAGLVIVCNEIFKRFENEK